MAANSLLALFAVAIVTLTKCLMALQLTQPAQPSAGETKLLKIANTAGLI